MTRLRYKHRFGTIITDDMLAGKLVVWVALEPRPNIEHNMNYGFIYSKGRKTQTLHHKNLTTLKKNIKNTLIGMGVVFQEEVRPRLKGRK